MGGRTMRSALSSSLVLAGGIVALAVNFWSQAGAAQTRAASQPAALFQSSTQCMACHNGLVSASGEDVSIGTTWRSSMMAHSAVDPYWHAGVRREIMDHPAEQAAIENECSRCHMPMAHVQAQSQGRPMRVFENVPGADRPEPLAVKGVSCTVCHQITPDGFGQRSSFNGGFTVDTKTVAEPRRIFGPYDVDKGRSAVMRSATGFEQTEATHVQQSELCATCHTLYTHAVAPEKKTSGEFPEQMPYREWLQSDFKATKSCQSCHMRVVEQPMPITSVIGEPREGLSRHDFVGANFFMLSLLNRFRAELGVVARPAELDAAVLRTKAFLQTEAATLDVTEARQADQSVEAEILVRNLAGHKLPSGYPSRRTWLEVVVKDANGRVWFASGGFEPTGAIVGNDNDRDAASYEPHYREIRSADQVQIYEAIMGTGSGRVTTGLLSAEVYLKDNRLLPRGFDKRVAPGDVAVRGAAIDDPDFTGGEDRVRYVVDVAGAQGPLTVEAQLWYQPIAFRWAENLRQYAAPEPTRFVRYYEAMAPASATVLARSMRPVAGR